MLTKFGKEMRKLRIDRGERMLDMAAKLKVSPAFISNIEHGRKEPPTGFDAKLAKAYDLSGEFAEMMFSLYAKTRNDFFISANSDLEKETIAAFARKLPVMSEERLLEIKALINEHEDVQKSDGKEE